MTWLINSVYLLTGVALSPMVLYRALRHNRYRTGWAERCGHVHRKNPDKPCIWLHGVSVGEINATQTVIAELEARYRDYDIVISATTDTGYARAKALYDANYTVVYFPLDLSPFVRRAFDQLKPDICLLMELEVWPNFLKEATRRQVPIAVINGRISDRSYRSYKRFKPLLSGTFKALSLILAQTQEYADRFKALGCPAEQVHVTGSLKYDTAEVSDTVEGADSLGRRLGLTDVPLWVAGGTGTDEEGIILNVFKQLKAQPELKHLRLAIIPRKPERFARVAQGISEAGFSVIKYSDYKNTQSPVPNDTQAVILGDTMGDLRAFYSLACVAFVGRSLVPMGGSDMMEVVALGKPTLFGPYTFNFKQTVEALLEAQGALEVSDDDALYRGVFRCLTESAYAQTLAARGRQVILDHQGATQKSVILIGTLLKA
ncbi:MAG: 3-deoxy-D-manno-octulosonic acid transferase [Phycisphaerae bacterium]|nr:3-deoxy-D-manno-octulosonic acid transferase [Phycisphaerae bacterium]